MFNNFLTIKRTSMKNLFFKPICVFAMIFLAVFLLNFTACQKDVTVTSIDKKQTASTSAAQPEAATTIHNVVRFPATMTSYFSCANNGLGETVELSGEIQLETSVVINGNNIRFKYFFNMNGLSGFGQTSGIKYQANSSAQGMQNGTIINGQANFTLLNDFRLISDGGSSNFQFHQIFHMSFNADGTQTAYLLNASTECK